MGDQLFAQLEAWQGDDDWGSVLDAGTGDHSLSWILGLPTERWTAVTGDARRKARLEERYADRMRPEDRVVVGNWRDPVMLHDERYDVVLADYLIGAIDGFAPYFQDQLMARLRPLVRGRLYIIGLEPYPDRAHSPGGALILEVARLRDACILLAGHRCYREYPMDWIVRQLGLSGFMVDDAMKIPILYGERFIKGQLGVCRRKLPHFKDEALARQMEQHINALEARALEHLERVGRIRFGEDHVIVARPV
ncbi:MAG: hypothetical protein CMH57_01990 [Myxococcales bacterium]|nr:hypothetical protein [Myxococcales bacterium]